MLDDSDLDFAILAWPSGGGWIALILGLVVVIAVAVVVAGNKDECAAMHCDRGAAVLLNHECLCVERPSK